MPTFTLSIETSCDDTSVALVDPQGWVRAQKSVNQDLAHQPFGGVVPEIAGRNHLEALLPLIDQLFEQTQLEWQDITGIAVTNRPGLIGSLLVGLVSAKTLALAQNKPFIGVHHIEGHILSAFLSEEPLQKPLLWQEPYLALVISGGHSHLYKVMGSAYELLGQTQDDAAGEAFDKFAKMLGLGYPGGVEIDRWAKNGRRDAYDFPRALWKDPSYDMSFSGLKSAGQRLLATIPDPQAVMADLCASYQEAIVDVLMLKLERAIKKLKIKKFVITGGVSANSRIRERAALLSQEHGCDYRIPPLKFCTDNASMIGFAGSLRLARGESSPQDLPPQARAELT